MSQYWIRRFCEFGGVCSIVYVNILGVEGVLCNLLHAWDWDSSLKRSGLNKMGPRLCWGGVRDGKVKGFCPAWVSLAVKIVVFLVCFNRGFAIFPHSTPDYIFVIFCLPFSIFIIIINNFVFTTFLDFYVKWHCDTSEIRWTKIL